MAGEGGCRPPPPDPHPLGGSVGLVLSVANSGVAQHGGHNVVSAQRRQAAGSTGAREMTLLLREAAPVKRSGGCCCCSSSWR
jgi:hypothetical protein